MKPVNQSAEIASSSGGNRRRSFLQQVFIFDVSFSVVLIAGLGAAIMMVERHMLLKEVAHEAKAFTEFVARESALPVLLGRPEALQEQASRALAEPDFLYLAWVAPDGRVIGMWPSRGWHGGLPPPCAQGAECRAPGQAAYVEAESLVIAEPERGLLEWSDSSNPQRQILATVRLGVSLERYRRLVTAEIRSGIPLAIAIFLAGCMMRLLGLRRIVRPLRALMQFTRRVASGELTARASVPALRETAELSVAFNQMLDSLAASQHLREQMQAAEEANRLKTEFLANMSHELRTPLNGILGMTQLAMETQLSPEQRDYLDAVWSSSNSLMAQLNGILDLSKIEAGKMELEPTEFEPADAIGEIVKAHAATAYEKSLRLFLRLDPEIPRRVRADQVRICQVLANLLSNAIKFTPRGKVVVRAGIEGAAGSAPSLKISVEDTGVGIPRDRQHLIFGAFTQADGSIRRKYGGTGLGLAICTRLMGLMKGTIDFDSVEGAGSTFRFSVPVEVIETAATGVRPEVAVIGEHQELTGALFGVSAAAGLAPRTYSGESAIDRAAAECRFALIDSGMGPAASRAVEVWRNRRAVGPIGWVMARPRVHPPPAQPEIIPMLEPITPADLRKLFANPVSLAQPAPSPIASAGRILVAEDSPINQNLLSALLSKRGFEVTLAANGLEAVAAAKSSSFDLILMDIQMPEMDGLVAARSIRAQETAGRRVPIIAITANAMGGDREACLQSGMDGYLPKPVRPRDLYAAIEKALGTLRAAARDP